MGTMQYRLSTGKVRSLGWKVWFLVSPCLAVLAMATALFSNSRSDAARYEAPDESSVRIDLGAGVSIALPVDWKCLGSATREAISATAYQRLSKAGLSTPLGSLRFAANLVAPRGGNLALLNAKFYPEPTGAAWEIREQDQLQNLSGDDLDSLDRQLQDEVRASLDAVGAEGLRWQGVRRTKVDGKWALLIEYARSAMANDGQFLVRVLRVPLGGRSFSVTASYRIEEESALKPVVDRVLNSIVISLDEEMPASGNVPKQASLGANRVEGSSSSAETDQESPVVFVFVLSCLAVLGGSLLGFTIARRFRRTVEASRWVRLSRVVVRVLLVSICVLGPLELGTKVWSQWDSPRNSGTFVAIVDSRTGQRLESMLPPLTQTQFRDARRITREVLQQEIDSAILKLLGKEPHRQTKPPLPPIQSELFEYVRDPIVEQIMAERASQPEVVRTWTERVRAARIAAFLEPIVLRDMSQTDMIARVAKLTGLNEAVIASDVESSVRIAKLMTLAESTALPADDLYQTTDLDWDYRLWNDWFDRGCVLQWQPIILVVVGLALVAALLAFFGFR